MSSYYPSFNYMGFNSLIDKHLIVASFDIDDGEVDTFLGMEPIYTDKADGSRRLDYGAKFNSVAVIKITVIKENANDFTVAEVRDFLKWTTGARQISYLDLVLDRTPVYSFLGRITKAYQRKIDARTVGMSIEFTSVGPWAYSPIQSFDCYFGQKLIIDENNILTKGDSAVLLDVTESGALYNGTDGGAGLFQVTSDGVVYIDNFVMLKINNQTDDLYTPIYLNIVFKNDNSDSVYIKNNTLDEETCINGISNNEVITLSSEQFIVSDVPNKIFGNNFNFIWPRLAPGENEFMVSGPGKGLVNFTYRYPMKIGDCVMDVKEVVDNTVCDIVCSVDDIELRTMLKNVLWSLS